MDIEIEELNLDDFDLEYYDKETDSDIYNIIYSYPYYSDDKYEYEFRATIKDDNIILDELISDDNTDNFDECIVSSKEICNRSITETINMIKHNKDIRNGNNLITNEYVDLNINNENKDELLEENKKSVLPEMYKELMEYIE
jgi:hypothetical protein